MKRIACLIIIGCAWLPTLDAAAQQPTTPPAQVQVQPPNAQTTEAAQDAAEQKKSIYDEDSLKPRDIYNLAVEQLNLKNWDVAIEGFSKSRDIAAYDNELRYNAAYNLAYAYALKAQNSGDMQNMQAEQLQTTIDLYQMSAAWFRDAIRQRPSLEPARGNLEIVLKQLLAAKDLMAQKFNVVDKQLDAIIQTQRQIRENERLLAERIRETNAEKNPIAFKDEFKAMANIQREALTQANLIAETVADTAAALQSKDENERSQEENVKLYQYQALSPLLESARQAMANARRQMRDMSMQDALRLTNKAYYLLKQAREQLDDPLQTLAHIAQDQQTFIRLSDAKLMFESPERLEQFRQKTQNPDAALPPWLNSDLLSDTQTDALERTNRLIQFLHAVSVSAKQPQQQQTDEAQAAAQKEQLEQIESALPLIETAASDMQNATRALLTDDTENALSHAQNAASNLALAMERFADLKHLIEIAFQTQSAVSAVVNGELANRENTQLLSRSAQRKALSEVLPQNIERLERLSVLLAKESAKSNQQLAQAAGQNQQNPDAQKQIDEQSQNIQQLFETAENLRVQAKNALERMNTAIAQPTDENIDENIVPQSKEEATWTALESDADTAQKSLEELRILFFSVVEHVQELLRRQNETLDKTTDVSSHPAEQQAFSLPPILERQRAHELTSDKLSELLLQQAEQMRQSPPQQNGADPAEIAQRYTQAAGELQAASAAMRQTQADLQADPHLFTQAIENQQKALEHIAAALQWLQPPQQQNQEQQQQQQQEQQQQQQQQQKMSKEQAEKKIQQIRSHDRERRKAKEKQNGAGMPTVEKDW